MKNKAIFLWWAALTICFALPSQQAQSEGAFRIGHPDLPNGCRLAAEIESPEWTGYISFLAVRLGREVVACGADAKSAVALLQSGDLDLALAQPDIEAEQKQRIRPILRARKKGDLPRTEVVYIANPSAQYEDGASASGLDEFFPPADDGELRIAAYSMQELVTLSAASARLRLDTDEARALAQSRFDSLSEPWTSGRPLIDPIEEIGSLGDETPGTVLLTVGRLGDICRKSEELCEELNILWRGFVPLTTAFAVSENMPQETLYRLIGMHVALHVEHPGFVPLLGGNGAVELEPTEPSAFIFRKSMD